MNNTVNAWNAMWGGSMRLPTLCQARAVEFEGGGHGPGKYLDGTSYTERDQKKLEYGRQYRATHPNRNKKG
jgi:hypothetical protein